MAVFDNLNYTTSAGVAPGVVDYYERTLLENAKPEMVHARDAQKRMLPENNGKHVNFRRMTPFAAVTTPLAEGVTPAGQTIAQTAMTVMVKPYGAHVEMTDELDLYHIDNLHRETAQLLADQAALSLDTICREAINAGMNVQYAGSNTARGTIAATDKLTTAEVKKAVRTLQRNNCKTFEDGFYHAIVHPDSIYDLTSDTNWVNIANYQDKDKFEKYAIGTIYGAKFYMSPNAKVFKGDTYLYGTTTALTAAANFDATNRVMTVSNTISEADARTLTGKLVYVQYTKGGTDYVTPMCVERVDATNKKVTFRWVPGSTVTTEWTTAQTLKIVPTGAGAASAEVFSTVVYGKDAFGNVELGGDGMNTRVIINPPGSSGAADPLEQRGTIAWKVKGFCCAVLQDAYIVRIEHGATA